MKTIKCARCGKPVEATTVNKKYCGSQSDKTSCAYLNVIQRTKDWQRANKDKSPEKTYNGNEGLMSSGYY